MLMRDRMQLSCDRNWPCQRCERAGRPEQCLFDTGTGQPVAPNDLLTRHKARRNSEEIRSLRAEIAQLKELLSKPRLQQGSGDVTNLPQVQSDQAVSSTESNKKDQSSSHNTNAELSDPRQRSPRGFYRQHTLLQFFMEVRCCVLCLDIRSCSPAGVASTTLSFH